MPTVGAYDAKTRLAKLLDDVENGEIVTITRHGRPVARMVPVSREAAVPTEIIDELRRARRGVLRGDVSVREMIDDGHR